MTDRPPQLSIIVPAYNEEERLPHTLQSILGYLGRAKFTWELIVVDDGSADGTPERAREVLGEDARCSVIRHHRNRGKGAAIRTGMLQARGQRRLFTDADNSTPIEEAAKLLRAMKSRRADVVIGSRAVRGAQLEQRQPFYREMMGRIFNLIVQTLALPGIRDTQCGFKLFTSRAAEYAFARQVTDGWSFDVEVLMLARRRGYRIVEVPVRWINSPASRVSPIRDSVRMFWDVLRIRLRRLN